MKRDVVQRKFSRNSAKAMARKLDINQNDRRNGLNSGISDSLLKLNTANVLHTLNIFLTFSYYTACV